MCMRARAGVHCMPSPKDPKDLARPTCAGQVQTPRVPPPLRRAALCPATPAAAEGTDTARLVGSIHLGSLSDGL